MNEPRNNILRPLLVSLGFIAAVIYTVVAFNSNNALWLFARTTEATPIRIIVIDSGEKILYRPGEAEFEQLVPLVNEAISNLNNSALVGVGLSDVTLEEYQTRFTVMEVHYDRPIQFATTFRTGEPTRLLFPLSGRHAATGLFFRGDEQEWMYGALRMSNPVPLYSTLRELGYEAVVTEPGGRTQAPLNGGS